MAADLADCTPAVLGHVQSLQVTGEPAALLAASWRVVAGCASVLLPQDCGGRATFHRFRPSDLQLGRLGGGLRVALADGLDDLLHELLDLPGRAADVTAWVNYGS